MTGTMEIYSCQEVTADCHDISKVRTHESVESATTDDSSHAGMSAYELDGVEVIDVYPLEEEECQVEEPALSNKSIKKMSKDLKRLNEKLSRFHLFGKKVKKKVACNAPPPPSATAKILHVAAGSKPAESKSDVPQGDQENQAVRHENGGAPSVDERMSEKVEAAMDEADVDGAAKTDEVEIDKKKTLIEDEVIFDKEETVPVHADKYECFAVESTPSVKAVELVSPSAAYDTLKQAESSTPPEVNKPNEAKGLGLTEEVQEQFASLKRKPDYIKVVDASEEVADIHSQVPPVDDEENSILDRMIPASDVLQKATKQPGTYTGLFFPPSAVAITSEEAELIETTDVETKSVEANLIETTDEDAGSVESYEAVGTKNEGAPSTKATEPASEDQFQVNAEGNEEAPFDRKVSVTKTAKMRGRFSGLFKVRSKKFELKASMVEKVGAEKPQMKEKVRKDPNESVKVESTAPAAEENETEIVAEDPTELVEVKPTKDLTVSYLPINGSMVFHPPSASRILLDDENSIESDTQNNIESRSKARGLNVPNTAETRLASLIDRFLDSTACGRRVDACGRRVDSCLCEGNVDDEIQSRVDDETVQDLLFDDDTFPTCDDGTVDDDTMRDGDSLVSTEDTIDEINRAVFILKRHATRLGVSEADLLNKINETEERRGEEDPSIYQ